MGIEKLRCFFGLLGLFCLLSLAAGCGSGGGDSGEGDSGETPSPPTPSGLSGTVLGAGGSPVSGATVSAFSKPEKTTTGADGKFSFPTITTGLHGLFVSKPGYIDSYRVGDPTKPLNILLQNSSVSSSSVVAAVGGAVTSNAINNDTASLTIPAQASGAFTVAGSPLATAGISVEYLDIHNPIPVPLPSVETRSADLNTLIGVDKQAPSVLVSIKPGLLQLGDAAALNLPNPDSMPGTTRILYFDVSKRLWEDTGETVAGLPITVTRGGVYGFFYEDDRTSAIRGTGEPGSIIFVSDQAVEIDEDGSYYIENVIIPADGNSLRVEMFYPEEDSSFKRSRSYVKPVAGVITDVQPAETGGALTISASPSIIVADGSSHSEITATLKDDGGFPIGGVPVVFSKEIAGLPANNIFEGTGIAKTSPFYAQKGVVTFSMSHNGKSNFIVWLWEETKGRIALLANEMGTLQQFSTVENLDVGNYFLQVKADGNWTIKIEGNIDAVPAQRIGTVYTDAAGEAGFMYTSTTSKGFVTILAEFDDLSAEAGITQKAGPPAYVEFMSVPGKTYANGADAATLKALVTDIENNPVEDGTEVAFSATLGGVPATAATKNGVATVALTSVQSAVTVASTVTGTVNGASDSIDVDFIGVSLVDMNAAPAAILADGTSRSTITVRLKDVEGVAVKDQTVNFTTNNGTLVSASAQTDESGVAAVEMIAPASAGTATVTAKYGLVTDTAEVVFQVASVVVGGISASTASGVLVADGVSTAAIRATVVDTAGGTVSGVPVTFATTIGSFSGESATTVVTNALGIAEVMLKAGTTVGTASVSATASGFTDRTEVSFVAGPPQSVTVVVAPSTVNQNGTVAVMARVLDGNGNAVSGETVHFSIELNTSGGGLGSVSGVTNVNGEAVVVYTAGSKAGTDSLRATAASNGVIGTADVVVDPAAVVVGGITVTSGSAVLVADGVSTAAIRAAVVDESGAPAPGIAVNFSTTLGSFTTSGEVETNEAGIAEVMLKAGTTVGTASVSATASGFTDRTEVSFVAGPPQSVTVVVAPSTVNQNGTVAVMARVLDGNGNAVSGETVHFSIELNTSGGGLGSVSGVTNVNGEAVVVYTAGSEAGTDRLRATAASNGVIGTADVVVDPAAVVVGGITLSSGAQSLVADGVSTAAIRAAVVDTAGAPAPGIAVKFSTTLGSFTTAGEVETNEAGIAEVMLEAGTTVGTASVSATASGFTDRTTVLFVPGSADRVLVVAAPETVNPNGAVSVRARVEDAFGNAVPGETVNFSIADNNSGGSFITLSGVTNVNGEAGVIYTAGSKTGTDRLRATAASNGVIGTADVVVDPAAVVVGGISVSTGSAVLVADGVSTAAIRATVVDTVGALAPGITVTFSTTAGSFGGEYATTGVTNTSGVAEVMLTSGTKLGQAAIIASASGFNATTSVMFVAGAPDKIQVSASRTNIPADGTTTSTIRATVTDAKGNRVDGEPVNFRVSSGSGIVVPAVAVTVGGVSEAVYTSSTTAGVETITAETSNGKSADVTVALGPTEGSGTLTVEATPASIVADGASTSTVTATLKDNDGLAIAGVPVTFFRKFADADPSTALPEANLYQGSGTTVTTPFYAKGGVVTFEMTHDGRSNFIVWLWEETRGRIALLANEIGTVPLPGSTEYKTVEDLDSGNYFFKVDADRNWTIRVEGAGVEVTEESVSPEAIATGMTDAAGQVEFLYRSSKVKGLMVLQAVSGGLRGDVEITQTAGPPAEVDLLTRGIIYGNGVNKAAVEASVTDEYGNFVEDGNVVAFTATLGDIPATAETRGGVATVGLTSVASTVTVTSTVTGTVNGVSDNIDVDFTGVSLVDMNAAPAAILADGVSRSTITVRLKDVEGVAVKDETVNFTTNNGTLASAIAQTDESGVATVDLIAPTSAGTATVKAAYGLLTVEAEVDFHISCVVVGGITVTSGSAVLVADGVSTAAIRAAVVDTAGAPAPGIAVNFSTTLGSFTTSGEVETNEAGIAEVMLEAGTTVGTASVSATASGFTDRTTVLFVPDSPYMVLVFAAPETVNPNGAVSVRARVEDLFGNAVPGETVNFSIADNNSGGSFITLSGVTNVNGEAVVVYTAGSEAGTDSLRATAASNGVIGTKDVVVDPAAVVVGGITVTSGSAVLLADGESTAAIRATVVDTEGAQAPGITVTFSTTAGSFGGEYTTTGVTNTSGVAEVMLTSGTKLGQAAIIASASGFNATTSVMFVAGAPDKIQVSASPANLTADGTSTSNILATVRDKNNNPVPDGSTVTFEADYGTLDRLTGVTSGGVANAIYTSPSSRPEAGRARITVTAANGKEGSTDITLIGVQIAGITLTADPPGIAQGGNDQSTITASVTVAGGGPAPDGTEVSFSIVSGDGQIDPFATTSGGFAIATLTSGNAESGIVRAEAGGRRAEIEVAYTPGSVNVSIVPNSVLGTGVEAAMVTALVESADGNPYTGADVKFELSDQSFGTISDATETGEPGRYTAVFSAASKGGTVTVTATATIYGTDVSGSDTVVIQPPPAFIEVTEGFPDPVAIAIKGTGGHSTSQVVFDVKDMEGNLVADGYRVDFHILTSPEGGEEISPLFAYTANGKVGTVLRSGYKSGPVSIKATYFHDTKVSTTTSQIAISGGPPVGEEFGITAEYRNISGLWKAYLDDGITVSAGDVYGNAVPDGTAISFKTYNTGGLLDPGSSTTEGGIARSTLKSVPGAETTPAQGFLSVTGEAVNGGRTAHVTSIAVVPDGTGDIVYIGTNGGGVYKSTDGGASWTNISRSSENPKRGQNFIMPYVKGPRSIAIDPDDHNVVYVGTGYSGKGNVYRSLDGGANWNSNNNEEVFGLFSGSAAVLAVVCDDGGSDYVWIGTEGQGAFVSEDGEKFKVGGEVESLFFSGFGTGFMSTPELSPTSRTESFTVTYVMPADQSASQPEADPDNVGDGLITSVETDRTKTLSETWTIRVIGNPGSGSEEWEVRGSVAGVQNDKAITDNLYVSDNGEVQFKIIPGTTDFGLGDSFTFTTTSASMPFWRVVGSASGVQQNVARTNLIYRSDNGEVEFLISTGSVDFEEDDQFTFDVISSGLGHGRTVRDIVKAPGSGIGNSAVLYAATPTGVFRSTNGGKRWAVTTRFTGDNIRCLAIHPNSNGGGGDIIYAGTQESGVWVSIDSGDTWINYVDGLGKGSSASNPVADTANKGNGVMNKVTVGLDAKSEYWTVTFDEARDEWKVVGTVSGAQAAAASTGVQYTSDGGEISFKITAGTIAFEDGDFYYFTTTRDPGREIRSLLIVTDGINNSNDYLYATTYFWGALAPHAVGNVYAHPLIDGTGQMQVEATWTEAAQGLPQYDPPDDQTLFAQHILAANKDIDPTSIFIGGEGINFYKAAGVAQPASGFYSGSPLWAQSKTGLNNLVMTRMLVLFSGNCDMTISENPAHAPTYIYTVYIQDSNGNPPIAGTAFKVETFDVDDKLISTPIDIVYPDALTYKGTFRDPSKPDTNNPYQISVTYSPGRIARTVFTYTPTCLDEAPGCSGSSEVVEFNR